MQAELPENKISPEPKESGVSDIDKKSGLLLKMLTGLLLIMFPVGFLIMFTDAGKPYLWTTTIFLGLQTVILFIILTKLADLLSVVITTVVIFMGSWFIEYCGVISGFPFGNYAYTHVLSPLIGGVPLAIMFAWFTVTASSLLTARVLLKGFSEISAVSIASVFILATDILLEPFASFVNNFWIWDNSEIPVQNFAAWLVTGILFSLVLSRLIKWNDMQSYSSFYYKIPLLIIITNLLNFSVVNLANGYFVITFLGIMIFVIPALLMKHYNSRKHVIL
ncbi:MAG: carotenoid biosynthesis protein [Ignavibacteria bacterium]|nr:carotenoid biosynthesis protein [Ignavibacteria bacterium]